MKNAISADMVDKSEDILTVKITDNIEELSKFDTTISDIFYIFSLEALEISRGTEMTAIAELSTKTIP